MLRQPPGLVGVTELMNDIEKISMAHAHWQVTGGSDTFTAHAHKTFHFFNQLRF